MQREWQILEPPVFVQHLPTHLIFQIYPDPAKRPEDGLEFSDYFAALVHDCGHSPALAEATVRKLGRAAICMCLYRLGLVTLD